MVRGGAAGEEPDGVPSRAAASSGFDGASGGAGEIQRGAKRSDATARAPIGIVTENATVFDGSIEPLEMPASVEAIVWPLESSAVTVIRTLIAGVPPGFRSAPRTTSASPDFSCV